MLDTARSRTLLLFTLTAPFLASGGRTTQASSPSLAPISQGVVRVINRLGNEHSIGSGALVERHQDIGVVVTCAHLFSDGVGDLIVFFDGETPRHALLVAIDKKNDLASLVVQQPEAPPVLVAKAVPPAGSPLASCGFGQVGKFHANHGQYLRQVTLEHGDSSGVVEISGAARQGDSGGPIFDARHQVVAVILGTDGEVVDGTHCGIISQFLARRPVTADLAKRVAQLASRPVDESMLLFRPDFSEASDVPLKPPSLATVRGIVRYGSQAVSGASIHLKGTTTRVATLDPDGRFVFEVVASGHYELKVDTVIHNMLRHAEHSIWVLPESGEQEIELKVK